MVKKEEIAHAANLIKIDQADHEKYVKQVGEILEYFDILDKASTDSESLVTQELTLDKLDRKSTRLNSSHIQKSRMPSSA